MVIGNLRREVVDIGVPLAVIGRGEEKLRVVVEEHEAHVVDGADLVGVCASRVQHAARIRFAPPGNEFQDDCQLGDLALAQSDTAVDRRALETGFLSRTEGGFHPLYEIFERGSRYLRCVGVKLPQLLEAFASTVKSCFGLFAVAVCVAMTVLLS